MLICFNPLAIQPANAGTSTLASSNDGIWQTYTKDIFKKAETEHRLILVFAKASWCEFCVKMNDTTLRDKKVIDFIKSHFIPIIIDLDKDRDIAIQYKVIQLPTVLILSSNNRVINQDSGYLSSEQLLEFLSTTLSETKISKNPSPEVSDDDFDITQKKILPDNSKLLLTEKQFLLYSHLIPSGGGISSTKKYIGRFSTEFAFDYILTKNPVAITWLNETLNNGLMLIDPVWGGVYDYSSHGDWIHPNYTKSLSVQALNIRLYAKAYALTGNTDHLHAAEKITDYMLNFLLSPEGGFYHSQSAKLNNGKQDTLFYKLNNPLRRADGLPTINKTIYADTTGSAIGALTTMFMVTGQKPYLKQAIKSMDWVFNNLSIPDGGYRHSQAGATGQYLFDHTILVTALLDLYMATKNDAYLERAKQTLNYIDKTFRSRHAKFGYLSFLPDNVTDETVFTISARDNAKLTRISSLMYHITQDTAFRKIAERAMRYVASPPVLQSAIPAIVLEANEAFTRKPLTITVIGSQEIPETNTLYTQALHFPSFYLLVRWFPDTNTATAQSGVQYPPLSRPAAFFCAEDGCSLPIYTPARLDEISEQITSLHQDEISSSVISNVTSLLPTFASWNIQQRFADILISHDWAWIIAGFWMIGLLLAFTPCVFPLLMVLTTLLMSTTEVSRFRMTCLTLTYILSLSLTYAVLGYMVATLGAAMQMYLQSAPVILAISLLLALLGISLLGDYKLKLPNSIQHYLISFNSFRASNTYLGAALMGIIVTLAASPCAAPPLIGVLSIFAEMGDPALGFIALFAMGIGIGTPLLFSTIFHEKLLPALDRWQYHIQSGFGLLLLVTALWMASRVIPTVAYMMLLAALMLLISIYMGVFKFGDEQTLTAFRKFWKALSIMFFIYGIALFIGALLGNTNPFQPLSLKTDQAKVIKQSALGIFQTANNKDELIEILSTARAQKSPVLIDFYASWCESCNRIEKEIFSDPDIAAIMRSFTLVRVDLSSRDEEVLALAKKFHVLSPPAIIFYDSRGRELQTRLYGDITKKVFTSTLNQVLRRE